MLSLRLPWLAALLFLSPAFTQEPADKSKFDLGINVAKGASVLMSQQIVSQQNLEVGGMPMESAQKITRIVRIRIDELDPKGELRVGVDLLRVQGSIELPMGAGEAKFDSALPAEKNEAAASGMARDMATAALAAAGKSFTARVDRRGHVVELIGAKALVAAADEGGMFGEGVSEDQLRELVALAFGSRPSEPVTVGAKWQISAAHGGGITGAAWRTECALAATSKDEFEVSVTGSIAAKEQSEKDNPEESEADAENLAKSMNRTRKVSNGKLTGTIRVARSDGFVVSSSTKLTLTSEFESPGGFTEMHTTTVQTIERTTEAAITASSNATQKNAADPGGKAPAPRNGNKTQKPGG